MNDGGDDDDDSDDNDDVDCDCGDQMHAGRMGMHCKLCHSWTDQWPLHWRRFPFSFTRCHASITNSFPYKNIFFLYAKLQIKYLKASTQLTETHWKHTSTRWMPVQRALDQPEQLASLASLSLPPWSLLLRGHLQLHWTEERHLRREGIPWYIKLLNL